MSVSAIDGTIDPIITVPSNDPTNTGGSNTDFTIQLPSEIVFNGLWGISLLSMSWTPTTLNEPLYVYTNLILPQVVGSQNVNLLAIIGGSTTLQGQYFLAPQPQQYKQMKFTGISQIEIAIRDGTGNAPTLTGPTIVTLLFHRFS